MQQKSCRNIEGVFLKTKLIYTNAAKMLQKSFNIFKQQTCHMNRGLRSNQFWKSNKYFNAAQMLQKRCSFMNQESGHMKESLRWNQLSFFLISPLCILVKRASGLWNNSLKPFHNKFQNESKWRHLIWWKKELGTDLEPVSGSSS